MTQKISIHVGNLSAADAIALVEELLEIQIPEEARKALYLKAATTGTIPKGEFFTSEMVEVPTDDLSLIEQLFGKAPDYNGVLGDSCDCPACNLRRADPDIGPDPLRDMDHLNIPAKDSLAAVHAGYAKTGRTPPPDTIDGSKAAEQIMKQAQIELGAMLLEMIGDGKSQVRH